MTALPWLPPLIRALATACIVVAASALAEALGPFWGALIASLPVSAGPAYVFLALQHGDAFVGASALASCAANAATGLFLIVYALLAGRSAPWRCLAAAVLVWLLACLTLRQIAWTPTSALALNLAVYAGGWWLPDRLAAATPPILARPVRRRRELAVRAAAVAAFVALLVAVSTRLGPAATGIAAVFPISLISLIVIVRPRLGGPATALLAANALRAMAGFGVMLLVLHLSVAPWGAAAALGTAMAVSLLWSGALLLLRAPAR